MKRRFYLFALALLLCCTACGQKEEPGVPALEETAEIEAMYGLTRDELLEELHLSEEDLILEQGNMIRFPVAQTIAGQPVTMTAFFDMTTPEHMGAWNFNFQAILEDRKNAGDALLAVYDEALAIYGEPNKIPTSNREDLLDYLELIKEDHIKEEDSMFSSRWLVGKQTLLGLSIVAEEEGVGINISYRMQPVIP